MKTPLPREATPPAAFLRLPRLARVLLPLMAWALPCGAAWAAGGSNLFDTTVVDQLFCGFLDFSKGRLAPFIAVAVIIIGVVGHWVGATKVWASVLYVAIGVGIIMGVGPAIAKVTSSQVQCLNNPGGTP